MILGVVEDSVAGTAHAGFGAPDPQDPQEQQIQLPAAVAQGAVAARTNPCVQRRLQRCSRAASIAITSIGIVVIAGWFAGMTAVTSLAPGLASMKFDSAVGLTLVGLSFLTLNRAMRPAVGIVSQAAATGYGLLGLATLVEDATGRTLGVDNPFRFAQAGPHPGRMAMTSAAGFVAVAISVLALGRGRPRLGQFAGLAVVVVGAFAVIGYAFGVSSLYKVGDYSPMAIHTAAAFVLAGLAALFARPDEGFVALVTGNTAGGVTVRRMLVPALVGPAVIGGLLDWAARAGRSTTSFRLAVFTIAMMMLSGTLVWLIAASLRHVDLRRAEAEDALSHLDRALSDRERALGLLRHNEERTRRILATARDAFVSVDDHGLVEDWNRAAEEMFGWRASEAVGRALDELIIPQAQRIVHKEGLGWMTAAGPSTLRDQALELTAVRRDGSEFPIEVTVWAIDEEGRQTFNSFIRDVSARKAAEARTKTSLDYMLDGFAILRSVRDAGEIVDFEWIYINPAGAASYGRSVSDLVGSRIRALFPNIDASGRFDDFCHVVNTAEVRSMRQAESNYKAIQGVFDYLAWKLDDGLAVTWRDVTDRERAFAAARSNEERFRASVEHLNEGLSVFVAVRDDSGDIVDFRWDFVNSAASEITGYSPSELTGRTLMDTLPHHGPSGMIDVYRNVVETGDSYVEPSLWYEDVWGDGRRHRRAFDVRATKLGDGFVVVTREVTAEREHEHGLARQRHELERSNTEMKLLNRLAGMLQSCATSEEAYAVATQSCAALFSELSGSISILQTSQDFLDPHGGWGILPVQASFGATDCWALRLGHPHVSGRTGQRCRHFSAPAALQSLCVPMMGPGETIGVLHVISDVRNGDDANDELQDPNDELQDANDELLDGPAGRLAITVGRQLAMAFANLRMRDSLREMSIRDPLTGLFNRRYMEETLNRELSSAARNRTEVGIVVIDVDHFKAFNDTHGHDAGDAILEAVGEVLIRYSRTSDVACRYGGEEFIVILPNCSLEDGQLRADDLRCRVSALRVPYRNIELPGPTISCGVAGYPHHGSTSDQLIHAADSALYAAKNGGRDRVVGASLDQSGVVDEVG